MNSSRTTIIQTMGTLRRISWHLLVVLSIFVASSLLQLFTVIIAPAIAYGATNGLVVGTYNILGYYHGDGSTYASDRLAQIVRNINTLQYDVVGLQEYRDAERGDPKVFENALKRVNPDWRMVYNDNGDQLNYVYNSSTVRFIRDRAVRTFNNPDCTGGTPYIRIATFATIGDGQEFLMINAHPNPQHGGSGSTCSERTANRERLRVVQGALDDSVVREYTGPILFVGDFNARPDRPSASNYDPGVERYLESQGYANARDIPNANKRTGGNIDHIYYKTSSISPPSFYETMDCRPVSGGDPRDFNSSTTCASDHTPVKAIFDDLSGGSGGSCSTSLSDDEKLRDQTWNNEFWDKTNLCTCSEAGSFGMTGNTNFKKIATYLSSKGLGPISVAGIMANFNSESANYSAFRIQSQNGSEEGPVPTTGGYGIAQFTPTTKIGNVLREDVRTSKYYESYYTRKYGGVPDPNTGIPEGVPVEVNDAFLAVELDFIHKGELSSTTAAGRLDKLERAGINYISASDTIFEALKKTETREGGEKDAAKIFMILYERPASTMDDSWNIGAINARGEMASRLMGDVTSAVGATGNSAAACATTLGATGNFAATVKAFAWEDGRRQSVQKTAYTEALKGRYKGGLGGNDCGAFVSALMVKSGFEPNYPGTDTSHQKLWLDANWEKIYEIGDADPSKLRAGDVAHQEGHVFVWIGDVEGFVSKSAEAAYTDRTPGGVAPTAIKNGNSYSNPLLYAWYRKKVN